MGRRMLCRGAADELLVGGVSCGKECGGEEMAAARELVAMGAGDLLDHAVGAQQAQLAADAGGESALRSGGGSGGIEESAQVTVAESRGGELASRQGLQQRQVGGIAD